MLLKMPLIGSGREGDERRVSLPTYHMVAEDIFNNVVVVFVPDADVPASIVALLGKVHKGTVKELQRSAYVGLGDGESSTLQMVQNVPSVKLSEEHLASWAAHLDERYEEHAGEYTPELA